MDAAQNGCIRGTEDRGCGFGFSSANKCLLKVAAYAAQLEQYQKAIEIFEQVRLPSAQLRAEGLPEFAC